MLALNLMIHIYEQEKNVFSSYCVYIAITNVSK